MVQLISAGQLGRGVLVPTTQTSDVQGKQIRDQSPLHGLAMASTSFRDSLNSMGWSRRDPDIPANTAATPILSRLQSWNPFGREGYVRLPTHNEAPGAPLPAASRREEEEGFFACECGVLEPSACVMRNQALLARGI